MRIPILLIASTLVACAGSPRVPDVSSTPVATATAPFDYVGQSWIRLDATVASTPTRLIFDTGGGVTLLSKGLCERVGCVPDGTYVGKRMSGQDITVPMARVASLVIAGHRVSNARVAVLDLASLLHPELGVEGFAAMDLFRDQPFTIDYETRHFVLESETSLSARRAAGSSVKVRVENDGPSTVIYLPLQILPGASPLEMEVDSGSRDLILDDRFMSGLGINADGTGVKRVEGKDETDHPYVRIFSVLPHAANALGAPDVTVPAGSTVMFQHIIHDGLVGHSFLSQHSTTFDIARGEMIFAHR